MSIDNYIFSGFHDLVNPKDGNIYRLEFTGGLEDSLGYDMKC